jgi:hypothetical protein
MTGQRHKQGSSGQSCIAARIRVSDIRSESCNKRSTKLQKSAVGDRSVPRGDTPPMKRVTVREACREEWSPPPGLRFATRERQT